MDMLLERPHFHHEDPHIDVWAQIFTAYISDTEMVLCDHLECNSLSRYFFALIDRVNLSFHAKII